MGIRLRNISLSRDSYRLLLKCTYPPIIRIPPREYLTEVKERAVTNFALWLQTCHPLDLILYTDGSQEVDQDGEKTKAGAGWADKWFYLNGCSLGKGAEVYDAEATAIVYGFQVALASPMAWVAPGIHLCLDNLSVGALQEKRPGVQANNYLNSLEMPQKYDNKLDPRPQRHRRKRNRW